MSEPTNAADGGSGGELDLDRIEARAERFGQPGQSDESMDLAAHYLARQVRPLVAEVRRLRALVVKATSPVNLHDPIPAPDYTMRTAQGHPPIPEQYRKRSEADEPSPS